MRMSIQDKIDNWELEILTIDEKQKEYIENNLKRKNFEEKLLMRKENLRKQTMH